jgi:hypothetical protein
VLILRTIISLLMLFVTMGQTWALNEARLLNQSTSGQTALFNLGSQDGIREGDYAVIVKQIRSLDDRDLRLVPAAKARNVKINSDSSVWILYNIFDQELLTKGEKYLLLSESTLLSGRRDPRLGRIRVVTDPNKAKKTVKDALKDDQDRLVKLGHKYEESDKLHEREFRGTDLTVVDVDKWQRNEHTKYPTTLYKSASDSEFRRQLRVETFEKLVTAYLKKINDPDFNYDSFYAHQLRDHGNDFKSSSNFNSEYETFLRAQSNKKQADAKLYRAILEKGDSWSEDFSDEELRKVLNEVSFLQEKDRRDWVQAKPTQYSVAIDYNSILTDAQDKTDSYRRGSKYAVDFIFEATPFVKHPTLERFTLDGSFRTNKTALQTKGHNTAVDEYSLAIGTNWYPVYAPYAIESPVVFLGAYVRSGFANLTAPTAQETAKYTALAFPGFRAGFKYILRNNIGLRIVASMETLQLEKYQSSKANSILPDSTSLVEAKLGFGLAYSF